MQALITGAAGGIGQALVKVFAEAGYRVIATDVMPQPNDLLCDQYLQVDLELFTQDDNYTNTVMGEIKSVIANKGLDVLINNAAVQILGNVKSLTLEKWRKSLDVNLLAPFLLIQNLLEDLEQTNGSIINISSIHACQTKRDFVAYSTTKAALSGMTRALAVELGAKVRINAIEPAAIDTPMLREGFAGKPELFQQLKDCHPQQRIGTAAEVARTALMIASKDVTFIHGACITLDGGISSRLFDPD